MFDVPGGNPGSIGGGAPSLGYQFEPTTFGGNGMAQTSNPLAALSSIGGVGGIMGAAGAPSAASYQAQLAQILGGLGNVPNAPTAGALPTLAAVPDLSSYVNNALQQMNATYSLPNVINQAGGMQNSILGPASQLFNSVSPMLQQLMGAATQADMGSAGGVSGSGNGAGGLAGGLGGLSNVFDAQAMTQILPALIGAQEWAEGPYIQGDQALQAADIAGKMQQLQNYQGNVANQTQQTWADQMAQWGANNTYTNEKYQAQLYNQQLAAQMGASGLQQSYALPNQIAAYLAQAALTPGNYGRGVSGAGGASVSGDPNASSLLGGLDPSSGAGGAGGAGAGGGSAAAHGGGGGGALGGNPNYNTGVPNNTGNAAAVVGSTNPNTVGYGGLMSGATIDPSYQVVPQGANMPWAPGQGTIPTNQLGGYAGAPYGSPGMSSSPMGGDNLYSNGTGYGGYG